MFTKAALAGSLLGLVLAQEPLVSDMHHHVFANDA